MDIKDYKYDLEFFYSNLLNHPAFLTGDKKQTEFQILFENIWTNVQNHDSFIDALSSMTMFFEDGHTNIELPYTSQDLCLNLRCSWNEINYDELLLDEDYEDIPKGSRILSVEDKHVDEIIYRLAEWIPHENIYLVKSRMIHYPYRNYHMFSEMNLKKLFGSKEKYHITFDVNGNVLSKDIMPEKYNGVADFIPDEDFLTYEVLNDTVIMHLNTCIYNEDYKNTLRKLADICNTQNINTFILDLSKNMGGDSSVIEAFIQYTRTKKYHLFEMTDYSSGEANTIVSRAKEVINSQQKRLFPDKIICKVSHDTFSSARTFAVTLLDNGIATVCGPPIGGKPNSYGMPRKMNLPKSNIRFRVSRAYFMRPNVGNDREMTIGGKP